LGHSAEGRAALELAQLRLAPNSLRSYAPLWNAFEAFCAARGLCALPATPATVARYVTACAARGTVRPTSFRPYLAVVDTVHRTVFGSDEHQPAASYLVRSVFTGWRRQDLAQPGAQREYTAPLPASAVAAAVRALRLDGARLSAPLHRALFYLMVAYATLMRPSSGVPLAQEDVRDTPSTCVFRPRLLKGGQLREHLPNPKAFPTAAAGWMADLVRGWRARQHFAWCSAGQWQGAPAPASPAPGSFWALPAERALGVQAASDAWVDAALSHLDVQAPLGAKYTPRCTRKGGASAGVAVGMESGAINFLGDWAPGSNVPERHYIDRSVLPCADARFFFGFRVRIPR